MTAQFSINIIPGSGGPKDKNDVEEATFGNLVVFYKTSENSETIYLTEGVYRNVFAKDKQSTGTYVYGCYLAMWLIDNYWRLIYQKPREDLFKKVAWYFSHRMRYIGRSGRWPDIEIFPVDNIIVVQAVPSPNTIEFESKFQFTANVYVEVPLETFTNAVSKFLENTNDLLESCRSQEAIDFREKYAKLKGEIANPATLALKVTEVNSVQKA